jgi:4-amino-4-deoxy-L-arabinose transferase-like glycosyltransferase
MALHKTDAHKTESTPPARPAWLTASLLLVLIIDIGLLLFCLSDPFGGFHGLNEAWYATVARNYATHSLLMPTYETMLDLYLPPLLSYLVYTSFLVLGPTALAARLVPVAFALLSVAGVYLLGRTLLRRDAGLEAAALYCSTPIFLLVGRNVQTEILFVSLSIFAVYFYARPIQRGKRLDAFVAGLFLGAALFSKQFAIVTLGAIVAWELLGAERSRLVKSEFMVFLLGTGLVLIPFYGYHMLRDAGYLLSTQLHGSASMAGIASGLTLSLLLSEMLWGCSPLFLIGGLAGLSLMIFRSDRHRLLIGLVVIAYFIFYLFLHKHSYYFFGMVPFLSLCFTNLSERIPRRLYAAALIIALAMATLLSAYQLAGCKYGFGEFKRAGEHLRRHQEPIVMVDQSFYYNDAPQLKYYGGDMTMLLRDSELSPSQKEKLGKADRIFYLSEFPLAGLRAEIAPVKGTRYGLMLGDRVYVHVPLNIHFFTPLPPTALEDYEVTRSFGPFVKVEQTSFYLIAEPSN